MAARIDRVRLASRCRTLSLAGGIVSPDIGPDAAPVRSSAYRANPELDYVVAACSYDKHAADPTDPGGRE